MRRRRPRLRLPGYIVAIQRKIRPIHWVMIGVALALVIALVILITSSQKTAPSATPLFGKEEINVGVATSDLAFRDGEGNLTGFEIEYFTDVLAEAYPDSRVVFTEVESQEAAYFLRTGEIDIAIGMLTKGPIKTQGLSLTAGYLSDDVFAFVRAEDAPKGLSLLTTAPALVLTTYVRKSDVQAGLEEQSYKDITLLSCTTGDGGAADLSAGSVSALVGPYIVLKRLGLGCIEQPICQVQYRAALWSDNSACLSILNDAINKLKDDGRTDELITKWSVPVSSAAKSGS